MLTILTADYYNQQQMSDLLLLLDLYAQDPMGGAEPLSAECRQQLPQMLQQCPTAISLLAYQNGQPAGLLNAFQTVSTFAARPLINVHDLAVVPAFRGQGIATALLQHVEQIARERDCCKLTLEVLSGNQTAQQTYLRCGFAGYELDPAQGHALFWQKKLV
ncbi:GNAT family N-acetyltransferase [Tolumonas auensis]|uniref:GNAT family N-acetyltransferase n=1 Tax=Tolumonas auensis TaxID=43948 RepID=UPI002AA86A22|nr:GNAT family N-acetyltransferase [Tolumonas auensis]